MQSQLLDRLDDNSAVYWSQPEIALYLQYSLRTWQSLTGFWKNRMTFNTSSGAAWYDLTQQTNTLIPFTLKDSDLVSLMLYQLLEPQLSGGSYVGSPMFSLSDMTAALQRRRDQFLLETATVTGRQVLNVPAPPVAKVPTPDTVIDVRRAAWITPGGVYSTLWKSDEWAASSFLHGWETTTENQPYGYSVAVTPPLTLEMLPPASSSGQVELIATSIGATLDPSTGVLLGVPDDFAWVVGFGALADLLARDGESRDIERAQYCQARWKEGIELAKIHSSIVMGYVNGVQGFVGSARGLDAYLANWQNQTPGLPQHVAMMSWNLIAVSPTPDAGPYGIQLDVVQNCPVPVNSGDYVQIGDEELDAILDYAQHLAAFKQGGDEFFVTGDLYNRFVDLAKVRNSRLKAAIPFYEPLKVIAQRQQNVDPSQVTVT